jgi:hypothetical protein
MRTPAKFLCLSISDKKLYQLDFDGASWSEFAVQPNFGGSVPGAMLCGTSDGRIAVARSTVAMLHWDPDTNSWESLAHPGFAVTMHDAKAVGPSGDIVAVGEGAYVFTYRAATKTWTKIHGPGGMAGVHGTSLTDIWRVLGVSGTGYVYHWDGASWSANLWPQIVADIGFDPNVPRRVFAVSPTEVYITTSPGTVSYGYEQFGQILRFDGSRWQAINPKDTIPTPYGDGIPDCAGWNASSSAVDGGLIVDDTGQIFTSGNFITITTNYIKQFGPGGWVNQGTFTQTNGSVYAPIIAAGGSLLVYGTYTVPIIRKFRGGVWTDVTTGFVGSSGSQPAILYGPDYPEIEIVTPIDGQDPVNPQAWVEFNALDGENSIAPAATTISLAGVPAWASDAPLTGFTGSRTAITGGHHYVIYRTTGWTSGEVVAVAVHAEDTLGLEADETWTFTALVDIPTCTWGGGQYDDPDPPYGLCLDPPPLPPTPIPTCTWGGGQYGTPEPPYGLCLGLPPPPTLPTPYPPPHGSRTPRAALTSMGRELVRLAQQGQPFTLIRARLGTSWEQPRWNRFPYSSEDTTALVEPTAWGSVWVENIRSHALVCRCEFAQVTSGAQELIVFARTGSLCEVPFATVTFPPVFLATNQRWVTRVVIPF